MAEPVAKPVTGLEHLTTPGRRGRSGGSAGVTLSVRPAHALAGVIARKGAVSALAARTKEALGLDLPREPRRVAAGPLALIWAGPAQWLVATEAEDGAAFETRLQSVFGALASVCDQSDARLIFRLAGAKARETLAKGMPIDLHPTAFQTGATALTLIGHIGAHIWQLDDAPTYDIAVARSYATDLWRFLEHAGAEFGIDVL